MSDEPGLFGTSGVRGPVGERITADLALSLGRALAATGTERVVVGRDARESGQFLSDALAAGLVECGVDVVRLGLAATPTIARAVDWRDADAGVAVTASHNPPQDNGLKFWTPSGQAFDAERRRDLVERLSAETFESAPWDALGEATSWDGAPRRHADALTDEHDGADLSVVVDVGNGVGGVAVEALTALGCDVETLNAQPDGRFPGRPSEPTAENCETLRRLVAGTDVDLGIALDGDADRMLAVTDEGEFVPGDQLLALFGREAAGEGDRVAAPVNTSLVVDDGLAAVGAEVTRTRVGDVYVAERATAADVAFGGEPSGAWIWPDATLCPDGAQAACRLVELVARRGPLSEQVGTLDAYPMRRTSVETDEKDRVVSAVADRLAAEYEDVETVDGVRVELDDAWFLVRASGTQPLVRVTVEGRSERRVDELHGTVEELVANVE